MNCICNNRKGTTLVEILVVMVILLVGIMVIIQMFPTGFRVVRAAESQTIATKLAQAEVERWKNMPGNLPDGILPITVDYGVSPPDHTVLNDEYPGPPFEGFVQNASGSFDPGNMMSFRYVRNEVTTIPVGSYFTSGGGSVYGSRYTLAFSPIEVYGPDANGVYSGLSVKSGDLRRRVGDSDSFMYLRPGQYGIDYSLSNSGGNPAFYVSFSYDKNPNHVYYISYSYWIHRSSPEDSVLLSQVDQPVSPAANGGWVPVEITVPAEYSDYEVDEVERNTDCCARGFVQLRPGEAWSDDPYEFWLADSILGVLAFNPNARNRTEYTARGVRAITARIDYRIYDPRIIREDKVVQAANEDLDDDGVNDHTAIKLALRFILNAGVWNNISDGDPTDNPDEPTFEGLVRERLGMVVTSPANLIVPQSMLIIDLATGLRVDMTDVRIDFKAGVVHLPEYADLIDWQSQPLPDTRGIPLKGRHIRFFYRADGDWSVQCHKAYTYYMRKAGAAEVDYWHFKLRAGGDWPHQLLFARCDSGKNVVVDYTYIDESGNVRKIVGRTYRTSDDWINDPEAPHVKCSYITLDTPPGATMDPRARIVVAGTSFRARTIWRDGTRWRYVDIDTNLTRNSTR